MTQMTEIWSYRGLVGNFAQRELKSKYKKSLLGWSWSLVNPVTTLLIYTLVFSTIFRAQPPPLGGGRAGNYTLFLFTGLIVWNFFQGVVTGGMAALIGAGPLLRKIYFPAFTPVVGGAIAVLVQTAIETAVLLVVMLFLGNVSWTWLLAPVVLALLVLFSLGVGLALALLNVYFRDVGYLVGLGLQLVFYATPIIYPPSLIPATWHGLPLRTLLSLNPLTQFVEAFRDCVYDLQLSSLTRLGALTAVTLVVAVGGWLIFDRRARDVSEEL